MIEPPETTETPPSARWMADPDPVAPFTGKPLLLLDIDGPINPYPATHYGQQFGREAEWEFHEHLVDSHGRDDMEFTPQVRVRICKEHRTEFAALAEVYDLVWCSFWENAANHSIAPLLGLPQNLRAVRFPTEGIYAPRTWGGSWKTPWLLEWLDTHAPGVP